MKKQTRRTFLIMPIFNMMNYKLRMIEKHKTPKRTLFKMRKH